MFIFNIIDLIFKNSDFILIWKYIFIKKISLTVEIKNKLKLFYKNIIFNSTALL